MFFKPTKKQELAFKINYSFKIILFANAINNIDEDNNVAMFFPEEIITSKDARYAILLDMYNGDLVPDIEWMGFAHTDIELPKDKEGNETEKGAELLIYFNEFGQLEGLNAWNVAFLEVIEDQW